MKKRILAIMCVAAMSISLLAACGSNPAETAEPTPTTTDDSVTEDAADEEAVAADTESEEAASSFVVGDFEATTLIDNEACSITITGIDPDDTWGYTLNAEFENKSADKNYMFSIESASINGAMIDPYFAVEVSAGKKAVEGISFDNSEIEEYGFDDITDIELLFRVYDNDDWMADPVVVETVHVYPMGQDQATVYARQDQETDLVLVDNENIKVVAVGTEIDDFWGFTVKLYVENKTERPLYYSADDVSVNGYMADPYWGKTVTAGRVAYGKMSWDDDTLAGIGITDSSQITDIEFTLNVYDDNDFTDILSETFTLELY